MKFKTGEKYISRFGLDSLKLELSKIRVMDSEIKDSDLRQIDIDRFHFLKPNFTTEPVLTSDDPEIMPEIVMHPTEIIFRKRRMMIEFWECEESR